MRSRTAMGLLIALVAACAGLVLPVSAQRSNPPVFAVGELRNWLTVVSSDAAQGREVFTEGAGVASTYIASELGRFGLEPAGDDGSYFQTVKVLGVRNRGVSSVTVTVKGQSRTFKDGDGVRFPRNQGRKQVVSGEAEFVGYGIEFAPLQLHDYAGRDVRGKIALYVGRGPQSLGETGERVVGNRGVAATETHGALAAIGPMVGQGQNDQQAGGGGRGGRPDFQTAQRLDRIRPPLITANEQFWTFVFSGASTSYSELQARVERRETLPAIDLGDVRIRVDIEADYEVVQTRLSRNIVGVVRGSDQELRDTYLIYGAHYDHVGILENPSAGAVDISGMCPDVPATPRPASDIVFNGADDDGSGTVTLMALAKAYATGARPRRSVLFVWHTGEEAGLYGSRYMADYPVVPIESVAAQLNIDMVGRNRCDRADEANTLYLVGSDRISTELHQVNEQANASLEQPLTLDYTLNDPADVEALYTRSDHYSYAAKGIPIIFYTTGLHPDYHAVTDEVGKIEFDKMARIAQLIYETGWRLANLDHLPARDNRGPRAITRSR